MTPFIVMSAGSVLGLWLDGQMWVLSGGAPPEVVNLRLTATAFLTLGGGLAAALVSGQMFVEIMRPYLKSFTEAHNVA